MRLVWICPSLNHFLLHISVFCQGRFRNWNGLRRTVFGLLRCGEHKPGSQKCRESLWIIRLYYQHTRISSDIWSQENNGLFGRKCVWLHVSCVRKALWTQTLPEDSVNIIMAAWRDETKRWLFDCAAPECNLFHPTATELTIFLIGLYQEGKGYSRWNIARSTAVRMLSFQDKCSVRSHRLVCTFLKGVSLPLQGMTWDADIVLDFLKKWSLARFLLLALLNERNWSLCAYW